MSFLTPFFLWLLPLTAIPLIIHLLNRRNLITIDFSTLRFLKLLEKESIRKLQVLQILLLILRTIIITNILLVGIAIINWLLVANYFYLFRPPPVESPLILAREFPLYFINMEFVAIIVLYIITIHMLIHRRRIEN